MIRFFYTNFAPSFCQENVSSYFISAIKSELAIFHLASLPKSMENMKKTRVNKLHQQAVLTERVMIRCTVALLKTETCNGLANSLSVYFKAHIDQCHNCNNHIIFSCLVMEKKHVDQCRLWKHSYGRHGHRAATRRSSEKHKPSFTTVIVNNINTFNTPQINHNEFKGQEQQGKSMKL